MADWFQRSIEIAGPVLTLAAIAGLGYKIGEHFGTLKERLSLDKQVQDANVLLSVARKTADVLREEAGKWKSKFEELSPTAGDRTAADKLDRIRRLIDKPGSIWFETPLSAPVMRPVSAGGRVVLTIANLKGGVGKTTISTHLAAALGKEKRVLFLDLDFQGSASTFLLRDAQREDLVHIGDRAKVVRLLQSDQDPGLLQEVAISLGAKTPNVSVIPAYYPLADAEERLMLRWVVGDELSDIRFNLRKLLHADGLPWDIVIIDAPPRMSTAMAQAIAASSHLLIPTQYESKSVEAALYFVQTLQEMRANGVCPQLDILGILPSVVPPDREVRGEEVRYLQDRVAPLIGGADVFWSDVLIPQKAAFRRPNLVSRDRSDRGAQEANSAIKLLAEKLFRRIWHAPI